GPRGRQKRARRATPTDTMGQSGLDILPLILGASGVVMGVMLLLLTMSLVSWYIIGYKTLYLSRATRESQSFLDTVWGSKRMDAIYQASESLKKSPLAQVFRAGYVELTKIKGTTRGSSSPEQRAETDMGDVENIERALRRAMTTEITHLESMVTFLATTGS